MFNGIRMRAAQASTKFRLSVVPDADSNILAAVAQEAKNIDVQVIEFTD